jgi:hypothetical protein
MQKTDEMPKTPISNRKRNANLGNRKPSIRQRKLIKGIIEGKSPPEAGKEAGYKSRRASYQALKSPTVSKWVSRSYKRMGLSDDKITKPLRDALEAICFDKFGNQLPDHAIRLRAQELSIKLMGVYPAEKHQLEVNQPHYQIVNIIRYSDLDSENPKPLKQTIRNLDTKEEIVLEGEAILTESEIPSALKQIGMSANRPPETQPQIENKMPANGPFDR